MKKKIKYIYISDLLIIQLTHISENCWYPNKLKWQLSDNLCCGSINKSVFGPLKIFSKLIIILFWIFNKVESTPSPQYDTNDK